MLQHNIWWKMYYSFITMSRRDRVRFTLIIFSKNNYSYQGTSILFKPITILIIFRKTLCPRKKLNTSRYFAIEIDYKKPLLVWGLCRLLLSDVALAVKPHSHSTSPRLVIWSLLALLRSTSLCSLVAFIFRIKHCTATYDTLLGSVLFSSVFIILLSTT